MYYTIIALGILIILCWGVYAVAGVSHDASELPAETDPVYSASSVADGVDWLEISNRPPLIRLIGGTTVLNSALMINETNAATLKLFAYDDTNHKTRLWQIQNMAGGNGLQFGYFENDVVLGNPLLITPSGNVGIGEGAYPNATLQVRGTMKILGEWGNRNNIETYQAPTDGFVIAYRTITSGANSLSGYSGSNYNLVNNYDSSVLRATVEMTGQRVCITFPVRKGDYWKIYPSATVVNWVPFGI